MKKETKEMLVNMVNSWNLFNPQKSVAVDFEDNEFQKGVWSLNVLFTGLVVSDFMAFFLPALQANNCIWFFSAHDDKVNFHIQ